MNYNRISIKEKAKNALSQNYWPMVGITIVWPVIFSLINMVPVIGWMSSVILLPVVDVSFQYMCYQVYCGKTVPSFEALIDGFKDGKFGKILGTYWVIALFTMLWSLLLVIPGLIMSIAYSMAPFIICENPDMPIMEAISRSKEMTKGHKMDIFITYLSFIGWAILTAMTLGILGVFYTNPYMYLTLAGIYDELKGGSSIVVEEAPTSY